MTAHTALHRSVLGGVPVLRWNTDTCLAVDGQHKVNSMTYLDVLCLIMPCQPIFNIGWVLRFLVLCFYGNSCVYGYVCLCVCVCVCVCVCARVCVHLCFLCLLFVFFLLIFCPIPVCLFFILSYYLSLAGRPPPPPPGGEGGGVGGGGWGGGLAG